MKVSGILLAGGKSSRLGTDKGLIDFKGKKLAEYSLDLLKKHCDEIVISTGNPDYRIFGFTLYRDEYPDKGPMGGIYTVMKQTSAEWYLVLACDLPLITSELIVALLDKVSEGYNCVIPIYDDLMEPLAAIYHRRLIPEMHAAIRDNRLSLHVLLNNQGTCFLNTDHLVSVSPELFRNMNSHDDLLSVPSDLP